MGDEFRNRIKKNIIFIEPLLNIMRRGEVFQSDFLHCPHCHTFVAAGIEIKEFQDIKCYKCDLTSRFVTWSKSDPRFYGPEYWKVSLSPIN